MLPAPTQTSLSDVVTVLVGSVVAAAVVHLIRSQRSSLAREVRKATERKLALSDLASVSVPANHLMVARKFHWSVRAFVLRWIPFLSFAVSGVCLSLLRDARYDIFPFPAIVQLPVTYLVFHICADLRRDMLVRRLFA